jgi:hypothetical protein
METAFRRVVLFSILLAVAGLISGCADHLSFAQAAVHEHVGFLHGIWHGMILPFSFLVSVFDGDAAIYAIYNNGSWYDFGFVMGCAGWFGGGIKSLF